MADGENVSVYFNEDEARELLTDGLDELDESRSAQIKEAIAAYLAVYDAWDELGIEHQDPRTLRLWLKHVLIEHGRKQLVEDGPNGLSDT